MKKDLIARINGKQVPTGKVKVSGAKNAGTRLLAASLIADDTVCLQNYPTELVDARYKMDFIARSGGQVVVDETNEDVKITPTNYTDKLLDHYDYPIRTTYLLVAGLIKRSGKARIPYPGGCKIGSRGYDLHIMVWEKLGATVTETPDYIEVSAPKGFKAGQIDFPKSTIGGTENALICASSIKGETTIRNAYISPEIENLIGFLRALGASIDVIGNSLIRVTGNTNLRGTTYRVMPDRIEALTWIVYGILSGGNITVEDVPFSTMEIPLIHLREAGIDLYHNSNNVIVSPDCLTSGRIQPFELACGTHPGIISDMQPFYTLLGLHADGTSRIYDYRYPERLQYCAELEKFYPGGLEWSKGVITTYGNKKLQSANANSTDLRGSMALVMAGLLADARSEVKNVEMALRGYNNLEKKLKNLGVHIEVSEEVRIMSL
jgi:UDP-N-acetylglucosamine 1-carboxyvinyltransferase